MKTYIAHDLTLAKTAATSPSMHFDGSQALKAWQKEAREKLTELLGLPLEGCEDCFTVTETLETDTYREIRFEFQSEPGYFIPGHLLIPKDAQLPLPGVICLQGHSTGKHYSLGYKRYETDNEASIASRAFAVQSIREGMCALVIDQRYMGDAGHQENGKPACLKNHPALSTMMWGRTAIGERVWDVSRLIDVVEAHLTEYIDPKKIICLGNSGGGTATFYAACMDERIRLAVPSCAVCTYEDSIMAMHHCACNYIPFIRRYFEMGDLGCLIAPRGYVQVNGKEDKIFPIAGAEATFENIKLAYAQTGKEDLCRMVVGGAGHQFYPEESWPIIHELLNMED